MKHKIHQAFLDEFQLVKYVPTKRFSRDIGWDPKKRDELNYIIPKMISKARP